MLDAYVEAGGNFVARWEAEIPDLTDAQVYTRFSAIVASLGDSHTSTTVSFQPLQASLYWWEDGACGTLETFTFGTSAA